MMTWAGSFDDLVRRTSAEAAVLFCIGAPVMVVVKAFDKEALVTMVYLDLYVGKERGSASKIVLNSPVSP